VVWPGRARGGRAFDSMGLAFPAAERAKAPGRRSRERAQGGRRAPRHTPRPRPMPRRRSLGWQAWPLSYALQWSRPAVVGGGVRRRRSHEVSPMGRRPFSSDGRRAGRAALSHRPSRCRRSLTFTLLSHAQVLADVRSIIAEQLGADLDKVREEWRVGREKNNERRERTQRRPARPLFLLFSFLCSPALPPAH